MKTLFILIFTLLTTINLSAEQIANDKFRNGHDGWTGDIANYPNMLYIKSRGTVSKTYQFNSKYANTKVYIKYQVGISKKWESSGQNIDYFNLLVNDVVVQTFTGRNKYYTKKIAVTLDSLAKVKISIKLRTNANNEFALLNFIKFNTIPSPGKRAFSLYRQSNIIGDMKIIGNSVKLDRKDGANGANGGVCAPAKTNNNNIRGMYAKRDSNAPATSFNSTSANLVLPPGVKSTDIEYALLNWQGRTSGANDSLNNGTTVKIKPFGQLSYQTVNTIPSKFNRIGWDYQGIQDITDIIKHSLDDADPDVLQATGYDKEFWVADVYAPRVGNGYGAWSLVVVYKDEAAKLRNISVYDGFIAVYDETVSTTLSGFITPSTGVVNSKFFVFAGEGDIKLDDSVTLTDKNGNEISLGTNVFQSGINDDGVNITNRNPSCLNSIGVDIRSFTIGTNGAKKIIGNSQTSTIVKLKSYGWADQFLPGLFAFSTDLYEPRICYKQEFADENGDPITDVTVGDVITVKTWISNMKKNAADGNLEPAAKVEIELFLDSKYLEYQEDTTIMKNIGENVYTPYSDVNKTGLADHFVDQNLSVWRVGTGADTQDGGLLNPNVFGADNLKAYIEFKTELLEEGNISVNNIYKVSYLNTQLNLHFGHIPAKECADIDNDIGVGGLLGGFNIVNSVYGGSYDITNRDKTERQNLLYTQVADRAFRVRVLSINGAGDGLMDADYDVTLSIIANPGYSPGDSDSVKETKCNRATALSAPITVPFASSPGKSLVVPVSYDKAQKNVYFRVAYNSGEFACSLDNFAIRPDKFTLTSTTDLGLLAAGQAYNLTLIAETASTVATPLYSVADINSTAFTLEQKLFNIGGLEDNTLHGTLSLSVNPVPVPIVNGVGTNALGLQFDDVGKVNMKIIDKDWAKVDLTNGSYDSPADCSANGAYICGNVDAIFIPHHFKLSTLNIHNQNDGVFTYLSNDLAESAKIGLTIKAENALNANTQNFTTGSWENPVNISFSVPQVNGDNAAKIEIDTTINLDFTAGSKNLLWNDPTPGKQLHFNYPRTKNTPRNPTRVDGTVDNVTATATSLYTGIATTANVVSPATVAAQNATFVYGRTHAPRQRFTGANGTAFIYYESFCDGIDGTGTLCNRALLPNGAGSRSTDDPRWFVNTTHTAQHGTVGVVTHKSATVHVTAGAPTVGPPSQVALTYDTNRGYPYKATMQNTASSWLIYNPFNAVDLDNEFQVEFDNGASSWAGVHENNVSTSSNAAAKTNRRSMW